MSRSACPALGAVLALTLAAPAAAQVAAETAILSGSATAQGRASRSLGSAISGSLRRAGDAVTRTRANSAATRRAPNASAVPGGVLPRGGNDLKGTDAPTYRVGNAASISVSGRLIQGAGATCVENCKEDPAAAP